MEQNKYHIRVYRTKFFKQWRWQIKSAGNNKIIAASSESFNSNFNCIKNMKLTLEALSIWLPTIRPDQE